MGGLSGLGGIGGLGGIVGGGGVGGVLAASYLTGQFPAGADVAQSGSSDYLRLYLPSGVSHVFWAHAGTSTQPSLSGSPTYHQIDVDGLEADAVTALFAQAIVNAGSPTPLWTISGYTQQLAPVFTVAPVLDKTIPAAGEIVTCGLGTVTGTVTGRLYQFKVNGSNSGGNTSTSAFDTTGLSEGDVLTCVETASNGVGPSTPTATSNSATITASAVISRVQYTVGGGDGDQGTSVATANFGSSCTAGNYVVVIIRDGGSFDRVTGVTDDLGTTYSRIEAYYAVDPGMYLYLGKLASTGTNKVTVSFSGTTYPWVAAVEVAGIIGTSPVDLSGHGGGSGTDIVAESAISASQNSTYLILGVSQNSFATYTAGASMTLIDGSFPTNPNDLGGVEELISTTTLSSFTPHITSSSANPHALIFVLLKGA